MANHRTDLERMSAMLSAVPSTTYTVKKSQPKNKEEATKVKNMQKAFDELFTG